MKNINNDNMIKLIKTLKDDTSIYFVTEHVEGMLLSDLL
jgi:hypothetical protein